MTRRLLLLNGLAILAVVSNHAAHTGPLTMFWWTFLYSPGTAVPNYDQFGTITYYVLIAIMKLSLFAVPSFLFVSGFFVSIVTRGDQSTLSWKWVRVTLARLLVPYLIWSLATFFINWLQSCLDVCTANSLGQYITILLTGKAQDAYWYVVLICQFYLLSPLLVALAKTRLRLLLLIAALAHVCALIVVYLGLFVDVPRIAYVIFFDNFFPRDLIYFVFGIAVGFHLTALQQWLARFKWFLLFVLFISAILSLIEAELFYRILGGGYNYLRHSRGGPMTVPMTLYIFMFILCFLAFENINYPFSRNLYQLGPKSYGIYLIHPIVIQIMPKIFYHLAPWLFAYQILYQPVLITISLGIPLLFMTLVAKSRIRGIYRYLFG
jgi:probable poly-beta-1,6-N-acetyl-D-glucosamine export protein